MNNQMPQPGNDNQGQNNVNFKDIIKSVLSNKNTLTILFVFAGIIALYAVYNYRVKQATTPVQIPYAKKEITSRTQITSDMIGTMEVPKSLVNKASNILYSGAIRNKYVATGYTIPQFSFFYKEYVANTAQSGTTTDEFSNIPDGYTIYRLEVDFDSTYGNSIYPGNYIDLYVKMANDNNKVIFGRLIKSIQVLSVVDSEGNNVFESSESARKPRYMFFAVPDSIHDLLVSAENTNVKIMPIPRNASYTKENVEAKTEPTVDSTYIQNYILTRAVIYSTNTNNTNNNTNTSNTNNTTDTNTEGGE